MEPYKGRLAQEYLELDQKLVKLDAFLKTDKCKSLDVMEQIDMQEQSVCMHNYLAALTRRLNRAGMAS